MSTTRRPSHYPTNATPANRLFAALLVFAAFAALAGTALAQQRYTVNRPITSLTPPAKEVPQESPTQVPLQIVPVEWETDYSLALNKAKNSTRFLLIYLYADEDIPASDGQAPIPAAAACREFETIVLDDEFVRGGLDRFILLKLPMNATIIDEDDTETSVFALPGFEHMLGHPGLVAVDYAHRDAPYYGQVTGILPFLQGVCPTEQQAGTFLRLPPGTLTQRTLTYAVRIHPHQPLSSEGQALPVVVQVATDHALYQAERGVLGHQNFGRRSSQVIDLIGGGMPSEICAQSLSGLSLFEGAIASMRLWRNSSAHWSIARKSHRYYGFDMALSKNGTWYAVGFFID